ncbi:hypothetical protein BPOR_0588g00010 [Botrytis porri]|uniref:Uncharacterized protein n=1 Tax=Botrytis porri TaxID=87229 RepID=A0A4Z1KDR9_9HELO|nr:hypothetical protein BPOR_0588g00010 [Botrytis porri]
MRIRTKNKEQRELEIQGPYIHGRFQAKARQAKSKSSKATSKVKQDKATSKSQNTHHIARAKFQALYNPPISSRQTISDARNQKTPDQSIHALNAEAKTPNPKP